LLNIKIGQLKKQGKEKLTKEEEGAILKEIQEKYDTYADPLYAASQLWVDGIIDPAETRRIVSECLECSNNNPNIPKFNPGVIQV